MLAGLARTAISPRWAPTRLIAQGSFGFPRIPQARYLGNAKPEKARGDLQRLRCELSQSSRVDQGVVLEACPLSRGVGFGIFQLPDGIPDNHIDSVPPAFAGFPKLIGTVVAPISLRAGFEQHPKLSVRTDEVAARLPDVCVVGVVHDDHDP